MIILSSEGCFWDVTIFDSKLMVTEYEVYLGKMTSSLKLVEQFINFVDRFLSLIVTLFN